jgi:hypothetical protein
MGYMSMNELNEYELAKRTFSYCPETGIITRIGPTMRKNGRITPQSVGKPAGSPNSEGYLQTKFCGKLIKSHRLAWLLQTGKWPKKKIDHINGIVSDNRWCNLRDVSQSVNMENQHKKVGRSSHLPIGITEQCPNGRRYFAVKMKRNGISRHSTRKNLESAIALLEQFRRELSCAVSTPT